MEYLSLHTKVRRLGYLKLLVKQYFHNDYWSYHSLSKYFERIASDGQIQKELDDYNSFYSKDKKGVIENLGTGVSAEPYIRLAEDLSLIARSNYSYILTKTGKIYKVILERYEKESSKFKFIEEQRVTKQLDIFGLNMHSNLFALNPLDKFFFLRLLIEKDLIYLYSLLNIIRKSEKIYLRRHEIKYGHIKENLLSEVLLKIQSFETSPKVTHTTRINAIELKKKIAKKNLKMRSYESIVEPRINWLLDLDLIDGLKLRNGILTLTHAGDVLLDATTNIFDINLFLENDFLGVFNSLYDLNAKYKADQQNRIKKYLDYAFINFKTLAPNRISASQAITYISLMCFLREGFILEYKDVKSYIFAIDGKGYTIDWFPSENDGSIKKINE